ncbi:hypothetical protein [Jeotgalibacillus aurantiacus]|uniref:hypothetical protein n=1 Tax=Jeotgalibacillus aurantiacus TaxID=2763266 RepID=UPI001D09C45E|nr:hypothetical protein [Jeotgalibacillus aurantiacus]
MIVHGNADDPNALLTRRFIWVVIRLCPRMQRIFSYRDALYLENSLRCAVAA